MILTSPKSKTIFPLFSRFLQCQKTGAQPCSFLSPHLVMNEEGLPEAWGTDLEGSPGKGSGSRGMRLPVSVGSYTAGG